MDKDRNEQDSKCYYIVYQDQKILELMMTKGEEEKKFYEERQAARLSWDEERRRQVASQNEAETRRRQLLARDRQEWENQRVSPGSSSAKLIVMKSEKVTLILQAFRPQQ